MRRSCKTWRKKGAYLAETLREGTSLHQDLLDIEIQRKRRFQIFGPPLAMILDAPRDADDATPEVIQIFLKADKDKCHK